MTNSALTPNVSLWQWLMARMSSDKVNKMIVQNETKAELSPSEISRYEAAWHQYRTCSIRYWLVFLTYIPGVLIFGWLLSFILNTNTAHGLVAFSWMGLWMVAGQGFVGFRCPRCGNRFFARKSYHNTFSGKCLNCGLRKYAYD